MRAVRVGAYLFVLLVLALVGNLVWLIGGNPFAVLLLGVTLLALPPQDRSTSSSWRRVAVFGAIGAGVTVASAALTLAAVLVWEGAGNAGEVAAGPAIWIGSACSLGAYMLAFVADWWAGRMTAPR